MKKTKKTKEAKKEEIKMEKKGSDEIERGKEEQEGRDSNEEREREASGSRIETRSLVENVPRVGGRLRRIRRRWITR